MLEGGRMKMIGSVSGGVWTTAVFRNNFIRRKFSGGLNCGAQKNIVDNLKEILNFFASWWWVL